MKIICLKFGIKKQEEVDSIKLCMYVCMYISRTKIKRKDRYA